MGLLFAGAAALMYGVADFSGGFAARRSPVSGVLVFSQLIALMLTAAAAPLVGNGFNAELPDLLWGMAAGASGVFGLAFLYSGLAGGIIAVVSPVAAVVGAGVPVLAGLALGETPGVFAWAGIGVSLLAIFLLGSGRVPDAERDRLRTSLLYGALAGLGFGGFFVLISRPAGEAGLWPLVASRCCSILLVSVFTLARGRNITARGSSLFPIVIAGTFDMGANIAFVLASRLYLLSVVSVISSLYPAPTVLLGRAVLGERLTAARIAGLVSAVAGVALMSV
jgi:drug/metabolite transporter (DMT)-like permease